MPKYVPYTYMDPLGLCQDIVLREAALARSIAKEIARSRTACLENMFQAQSSRARRNAAGAGKLDC